MIEISDVTKRYGSVTALDGVSMTVDEGSAVGLVGTNGAGKTTLFRLLVGHATPDAGDVRVAGREPTAGAALRERVGFVPEDASFDPRLTAREVLALHARLRGVPDADRAERVERVLATVGLADAADRRVAGYSNGMTQRLAIGTALVRRPDVLLLDEPTAALDPRGVEAFNAVVDRVRERTSVTLVVTSHVLSEVERLCDRVVVMDDGGVVARGSVADVRAIAGDAVTVRLRPGSGTEQAAIERELEDALEPLRADADDQIECDVRDDQTVVTCPRTVAFDVVAAARERLDLAGFEVEEPGLADAFAAAIDEGTTGQGAIEDASNVESASTNDADVDGEVDEGQDASAEPCADGGVATPDHPVVPTGSEELPRSDEGTKSEEATGFEDESSTSEATASEVATSTRTEMPSFAASLPAAIAGIARREYRIASRSRWPLGLAVLFATFTVGVVQYGATDVGASTIPAVVASVAALSTYVVPLAALAFGYATVVGPRERGELDVLYALPVPRWSVVVGAYAGRAFAFAGAVVLGYAAGGAALYRVGGATAVGAFLPTIGAAALAGLAFLAIAVLVSTVASEKAHALGGALLAWAWFVLVHDVVALTAIVLVDLPASALAALVAVNPAAAMRVLGAVGVPSASGTAGALGATDLTPGVLALALVAWIVGAVGLAAWFAGRRR
jgi:Cu-processing system ATP-binding protein